MTPDEERAVLERAAMACEFNSACCFAASQVSASITWDKAAAVIRALPLTTESAATQIRPEREEGGAVNSLAHGSASAADPTDSEGWSKDPNHWANKESAPAQSSTADKNETPLGRAVRLARGHQGPPDYPITFASGQGDIAQGAAPLEPVRATCFHDIGFGKSDSQGYPLKTGRYALYPAELYLYAIPPGCAPMPIDPTGEILNILKDVRDGKLGNVNAYRAMLAAHTGGPPKS